MRIGWSTRSRRQHGHVHSDRLGGIEDEPGRSCEGGKSADGDDSGGGLSLSVRC